MAYRDDVAALEARHAALDDEVTRQTVERDRARALLDDAKARLRLPVLDDVRVASPCKVAWEAMVGDDQVRRCAVCDKDVFNLSGMTRDDAEAVITAANGTLCVRYFKRADGTILTADCPVGKRRVRKRRLVVAGATVMVAAAGLISYDLMQVGAERLGAQDAQQLVTPTPTPIAPVPLPPPPVAEGSGMSATVGQMVVVVPAKPTAPHHVHGRVAAKRP
jgi:hypothetical protein